MSVVTTQLDGRAGLRRFIDVPFRLRDRSPSEWKGWVPPLRMMVRDTLVPSNPFWRVAERALFVAERAGQPVGRIAAIENRSHNRHHGDRVGFFGFFECAPDPEAAAALLERAEQWLAERDLNRIRGPISPSMNHESGLLVDGFAVPPTIMTPWNPRYYGGLVEGSGYAPAQDLLAFDIPGGGRLAIPERVSRLAELTRRSTGVTFRTLDVKTLEAEARKALELYCEAWEGNWGFTPPTWDEFWHTARDLRTVLVPEYSYVAEVGGDIVGFMLVVRDLNRVLVDVPSGRLWPTTLWKLARGLPRVRHGRIVLLGMRRTQRHRGLFPLFAWEAARLAQRTGIGGAEASWVLDGNTALTAPLEAMGIQAHKRWRIYERATTREVGGQSSGN
jgi:hypothetical protein